MDTLTQMCKLALEEWDKIDDLNRSQKRKTTPSRAQYVGAILRKVLPEHEKIVLTNHEDNQSQRD